MTEKAIQELNTAREKVEAGDSSIFEKIAQRELFLSLGGVRGALVRAMELYEEHDKIFSRRARKPASEVGKVQLPKLVSDMKERDYP